MNHSQTITHYQPILHAIAMKMVGSIHDAEDIVQETFLKWLTIEKEKINNTKSYLVKAVTNNCINHLNTLKRKKDECLESLNPSDLIDRIKESDFAKFDLENEISEALKTLHKKLEPLEKGVYLFREVFNYSYDELQDIFDKKKDHCRQLVCRAKDKIAQESQKIKSDLSHHSHFFESFKKACSSGQSEDLIQNVRKEIDLKQKNK